MRFFKWFLLSLLLLTPKEFTLAQAPDSKGPTPPSEGTEAGMGGVETMEDDIDQAGEEVGPTQPEPPASLIESFFNDLNAGTIEQKATAMMAPNIVYDDPSGHYTSRERALEHLRTLLGDMQTLNVDVKEEFVSGEETVALWTMTFTNKHLRSGEPISLDGVTRVRVQGGKIITQSDQYDLGAAYYENLPVLGWLVRWAKGKISA